MGFFKKYKVLIIIISSLIACVILLDGGYSAAHSLIWRDYDKQKANAIENGYNEVFTICNREENVTVNGREYVVFRAHRKAIIDGDYLEYIIAPIDDKFIDNAPESEENLAVFANSIKPFYGEEYDYTLTDIYSVVDYPMDNINKAFFFLAIFNLLAGMAIIVLATVLLILFVRLKLRKKKK